LGNVITVPVDQALIYVQPLYVQAANNPVPRLEDVIAVYHGQAVHGGTLNAALCQLPWGASFCSAPGGTAPPPSGQSVTPGGGATTPTTTPTTPTTPTTGGTTPTPVPQTVQALLADAVKHFNNANTALTKGDLATYQKEIGLAQQDINEAQTLAGGPPSGSTTTTPTTVPGTPTTSGTPTTPPSSA
jgi:uncharacterized protein